VNRVCTTFVYRKEDLIIGMNFDNNGMRFSLKTGPGSFVVFVDSGRGFYPSFGITPGGLFFNNLMMDPNGLGQYKRPSRTRTHTSKFIADIIEGRIQSQEIDQYIHSVEFTNVPDFALHSLICDENGDIYVIEPGHGILSSPRSNSAYFVMTNFSLLDYQASGIPSGTGADRFATANSALKDHTSLSIDEAFTVLESVKQDGPEWTTAFSMVYSQKENCIQYCYNRDFLKRESFSLKC
jgi:hypothetical protein